MGIGDQFWRKSLPLVMSNQYEDGGKFTKLLKSIKGYFHFAKAPLLEKPELVHIHSSFGASFYRKNTVYLYGELGKKEPIINRCSRGRFRSVFI